MQNEGLPRAAPSGSPAKASTAETAPSEKAEIMNLLTSKAKRVCCGLTLLLSFTAVAQESPNTATVTVPPRGKLLALAPWRVSSKGGRLFCEVSQGKTSSDSAPLRVLTIYRAEGTKLVKIFSFETPDSLVSMYQIGDYNGRFFTTWVAGSAYHLRAWTFADGRVKPVLDQGAKLVPELVFDEQGRESVLITDPVLENGKWTLTNGTTTVFKWNGETYGKIGAVSWTKRFQCVTVKSCTSLVSRSAGPPSR